MKARVISSTRLSQVLTTSVSLALLAGCGTGSTASSSGTPSGTGAGGQTGVSTGSSGQVGSGVSASSGGQVGSGVSAGSSGQVTSGVSAGSSGQVTSGVSAGSSSGEVTTAPCGALLPLQTSESVLTRGKNAQRTAHFVEPSLTRAAVGSAKFGPDTTFNTAATFTGSLESVPLFLAGATAGTGTYFVASHGNGNSYITAISEATGKTLWSHNMGASGNGVRSTPVIDPTGSTIYSAFDAGGGSHFEIHALSIANMGTEVAGWPVLASNITSTSGVNLGSLQVGKEIQRGALSLVNGILYVPFGGVYGDGPSVPSRGEEDVLGRVRAGPHARDPNDLLVVPARVVAAVRRRREHGGSVGR